MSTTIPKKASLRATLSFQELRREFQLYQQECKLYHRLLLTLAPEVPKVEVLRQRVQQACHKEIPELLQALRDYEGQSANTTTAGTGRSHLSYFLERLDAVRGRLQALKYEIFDLLHQYPLRPEIW